MKRMPRFFLCLCLMAFVVLPVHKVWAVEEVYEKDGTALYYRLSDGSWGNEHWELHSGDWYYIGADGNVLKDNVIVAYDDNYYVLDRDGRMLRSQKIFKNGLSYVIDEHGVAVVEPTEEEQILTEYAKGLVGEITNSSMSLEEKCHAIFRNRFAGFTYDQTNETDMNTVDSAMKAFDLGSGNCYVIYAKLHYMYQALGVKDMLVFSDNGTTTGHWWNMVKVGEHYYHVDGTPFTEGGVDMLTTDQLHEHREVSEMLRYLYQYREDCYPKSY